MDDGGRRAKRMSREEAFFAGAVTVFSLIGVAATLIWGPMGLRNLLRWLFA